jgi:hypothetical protein
MRARSKGGWRALELAEELLRVDNSILLSRIKQRYIPSDYGPKLARLSERRVWLLARLEGGTGE